MISVLIIDDKKVVRRTIVQLLSETDDIRVTGQAAGGRKAMDMLVKISCDVVLLDITMPDLDGFQTLKLIRGNYPDLPVIMLSIFPEDQYAARALKASANGYVCKSNASIQLISAIRKTAMGEKYFPNCKKFSKISEQQTGADIKETEGKKLFKKRRNHGY